MFFLRFSVLLLFLLTFSLLYSPMFSSIFFLLFFCFSPLKLSLVSFSLFSLCSFSLFFLPFLWSFFFLWFQKQSLHFKPSLVSFPMFSQTMLFPFYQCPISIISSFLFFSFSPSKNLCFSSISVPKFPPLFLVLPLYL